MACIFYNKPCVFFRVVKSLSQHARMSRNWTGILHVFRHVCLPVNIFVRKTKILKKHLCDWKIFHYICGIIKRKKKTRFTNSHITWKQTKGEGTEIPSRKSSALTFAKEKLKEMSGFSAIWCTKKNCVLQFHNSQKHLIAKIFIAKRSFRRNVFAVRKYFYIFAC